MYPEDFSNLLMRVTPLRLQLPTEFGITVVYACFLTFGVIVRWLGRLQSSWVRSSVSFTTYEATTRNRAMIHRF